MLWIPGKGFKYLGLLELAEIALCCLKYKPAASLLSTTKAVQGPLASASPQLFLALLGQWMLLFLLAMGDSRQ